ncbi:hypothetical protein RO3G_15193 [Rhizopus delemar RA 99-880]|uniref:Uncharacterized protein n=1 Tax=Rhizopus delemar (strain RA 99-880 / ATCC MYA-4621 / FGSC 9543 / NRRL 43880) TaxID=246409 RepID=I1CPV2_RHIO9|nr:hypothetical protein RO3G_15193 [Rhizopus delemar RA 99-880]|eukprot:EIE90482.1 hypothetical protein RO3G_15193 [Rhizopus delemar RA 99-880]
MPVVETAAVAVVPFSFVVAVVVAVAAVAVVEALKIVSFVVHPFFEMLTAAAAVYSTMVAAVEGFSIVVAVEVVTVAVVVVVVVESSWDFVVFEIRQPKTLQFHCYYCCYYLVG